MARPVAETIADLLHDALGRVIAPEAREAVAAVAAMEEHALRLLDEIADAADLAADKRWLAAGRTDIEKGFMAVRRSIQKPERLSLPELDDEIVEPFEEIAAGRMKTGWVLERADSPVCAPIYYAPSAVHESAWTGAAGRALRFAREIDASTMAATIGVAVRVCEHVWGDL